MPLPDRAGAASDNYVRGAKRPGGPIVEMPAEVESGQHDDLIAKSHGRPVRKAHRRFLGEKMKRRTRGAFIRKTGRGIAPDDIFGLSADFERPILKATCEVLWAYFHLANWDGEQPKEPFPQEIAFGLWNALIEIAYAGKMPLAFKCLLQQSGMRGAPMNDPRVAAVRYVKAARCGEIPDKTPINGVMRQYKVTRQAVQQWVKDRDLLNALTFDHLPRENPRQKYGIPEVVSLLMRKEGERFQAFKPHNRPRAV